GFPFSSNICHFYYITWIWGCLVFCYLSIVPQQKFINIEFSENILQYFSKFNDVRTTYDFTTSRGIIIETLKVLRYDLQILFQAERN
ncbi:MAG: hypothetical protein FWG68_00730, partial [Defluviitaleaceae bacterium]|nr:hypothetical protein [Defluviitaleaceae bacterium]